jgi:hypothetical protein
MLRILFLALCVTAGPAFAAPIPGLFDTGVDNNRLALSDGAIDPHYWLVASSDPAFPGPNAYASWPIASGFWLANTASSRWIGPAANEGYPSGAPSHPGGGYTFRITFDLAGFDTTSVQITGGWCADNNGSMQLNGKAAGTSTGGYSSLTPFTITSGFKSGLNTLDFISVNTPGGGANPTAVRVQGLAGTGTPLLLGVGDPAPWFALATPAPNPASSSTRIGYSLARAANVRLSVRNIAGREVRRLIDRVAEPGTFEIAWDGLTADGIPAAPGIYFVVLESDGWSTSRRLAWLR